MAARGCGFNRDRPGAEPDRHLHRDTRERPCTNGKDHREGVDLDDYERTNGNPETGRRGEFLAGAGKLSCLSGFSPACAGTAGTANPASDLGNTSRAGSAAPFG